MTTFLMRLLQDAPDAGSGAGSGDAGDAGKGGAADKGGDKSGADKGADKTGDKGKSSIAGDAAGAGSKDGDAGKGQGDGSQGDGSKTKDGDASAKPPAKYELTIPEGGRVFEADVKRIEAMARKFGWSNEDAQAAIAEFDENLRVANDAMAEETQADPDYGGAKLDASKRAIGRVINLIRPEGHPRRESFMRKINRGIGNDIDFVSFLTDLGNKIAEDKPGSGSGGGDKGAQRPEDRLYDHPTSQAAPKG